ncbi:hypothetical protein [Blastococcus brunescens]|uniref:Uncharacterized protein n=1 Tax=Blastococcus brunescens TaxID=1564165 RepID=A0ABZ1B267_9ACTN|nr:hypothetical protein [Blastococcus sp. BMG 8361]WRL64457.1 hypothetical protein U6N30_00980 [Blastococcus sp. BMG 8361]
MDAPEQWLLTAEERGNPGTPLPAWTEGNLVRSLVHGVAYFDRLVEVVEQLGEGDRLWFTDWRGTRTSGCDPTGPRWTNCSAPRRTAVWMCGAWCGARTPTPSPTARRRTGHWTARSRRTVAGWSSTSACAGWAATTRRSW